MAVYLNVYAKFGTCIRTEKLNHALLHCTTHRLLQAFVIPVTEIPRQDFYRCSIGRGGFKRKSPKPKEEP